MIKCPKCGKEYRDDAVFCTDCGIRLHEQYAAPTPMPVLTRISTPTPPLPARHTITALPLSPAHPLTEGF